jgi:tetratricopeptide (TPR) repeat protein
LREDRPAEALQAFGDYAQANPTEGIPRVGYALALAELGRLDKGIRAMRRALQENSEALSYVAIDGELRPKVERVKGRYEQSEQFFDNDPGGSFMLAALYYLLDDMDAAQKAMERNIDSYDTSTSARNLKRLIEEEIQVP